MLDRLKTLIITLLFGFSLLSLAFSQETFTITAYYPSPSGNYDELGTNKLAVDINGVAVPTEYAAMQDGDAHIGRSLIVGAGGGSGFAYDEGAVTADGTVLIKGNVLIGTTVLPATSPRLYVIGSVEADGFRAYETIGAYAFIERGLNNDNIVQLGGATVATVPESFITTLIDGAPLLLQTRPLPGTPRYVGIGTTNPQSLLEVATTGYFQFSRTSAGAPLSTDCDSNAERGRMLIDTISNRLYICNGASRGWDYFPLMD